MIWLSIGGGVIVLLVVWFFLSRPSAAKQVPASPSPAPPRARSSASSSASSGRAGKAAAPRPSGSTSVPAPAPSRKSEPAPASKPGGSTAPSSSRTPRPALPRLRADHGDEEEGNTSLTMLGPVIDTAGQGAVQVLTPGADLEETSQNHRFALVTAAAQTDKGMRRKHNEDSFLMMPDHGVFLVADGMGGHQAGEVASQVAAQTTGEIFREGRFPGEADPKLPREADELRRTIQHVNAAIFAQAQNDGRLHGMGTTVVAARFSTTKRRACIAHVGDSRCYRLRQGRFEQLTVDHTLGTATGVAGSIGDRLTRAVGIVPTVSVDISLEKTLPGDVYLLCSDGLSKMLSDQEITGPLSDASDLPGSAQRLIDMANQRGGRDNITVVLVRVDMAQAS